jgi:AcrR family transcriptional regulator
MESTRRRLTAKQADTIQRLSNAALAVLATEGFGGLTIRLVAAEAGVGAATAYTYFSSKEHLVAEVFWRRLASATPPPHHDQQPPVERVTAVLRHIALLVADEPEFAGAVTNALLGRDPDVEHLRERIAIEIRRRLLDAVGPEADRHLVAALELLYTGALVHAGMGYVSYAEIADRLDRSARLLFANQH